MARILDNTYVLKKLIQSVGQISLFVGNYVKLEYLYIIIGRICSSYVNILYLEVGKTRVDTEIQQRNETRRELEALAKKHIFLIQPSNRRMQDVYKASKYSTLFLYIQKLFADFRAKVSSETWRRTMCVFRYSSTSTFERFLLS